MPVQSDRKSLLLKTEPLMILSMVQCSWLFQNVIFSSSEFQILDYSKSSLRCNHFILIFVICQSYNEVLRNFCNIIGRYKCCFGLVAAVVKLNLKLTIWFVNTFFIAHIYLFDERNCQHYSALCLQGMVGSLLVSGSVIMWLPRLVLCRRLFVPLPTSLLYVL